MELTGKLIMKGETKAYGTNNFLKREIAIETMDQYPQKIKIELIQDNTALADGLKKGEEIKVSINITGRDWTNPEGEVKYFNSIQGWRIEKVNATEAPTDKGFVTSDDDDDTLPF